MAAPQTFLIPQRNARTVLIAALLVALALLGACSTSGDDVTHPTDTSDGSAAEDGDNGASDESDENDGQSTDQPKQAAPIAKYAGFESEIYSLPERWICLPDRVDTCSEGLVGSGFDVTVVADDDTLLVEQIQMDPDAPIDCFYVYPTVSGDLTPISDFEAGLHQEVTAAYSQAAGLGTTCRMFAPIYRQATLTNLGSGGGTELANPREGVGKYNDVLDAWSHYMANYNNGRGVVLIGHSQGSSMIRELLQTEFDGPVNEAMRNQLVAAYLAGWSISVPSGQSVGGDFADIPACTENGEVGCIVSWASYDAEEPPGGGGIFGRSSGDAQVAICQHPGDLSLRVSVDESDDVEPLALQSRFLIAVANEAGDGVDIDATRWVDPTAGNIETPFIEVPGLFSARCVQRDGLTYLEVHQANEPDSARQVEFAQGRGPTWGLHIMDISLVFSDMAEQISKQAKTYSRE